jgi:hypothetical protein
MEDVRSAASDGRLVEYIIDRIISTKKEKKKKATGNAAPSQGQRQVGFY